MGKYSAIAIIFILFGLLLANSVAAHQPRIVSGEGITEIENPEVSQAFYGKLEGKPDFYQIKSEEPFDLYIGVLVPDLEGIDKDVSVEVTSDEKVLFLLDGLGHEWTYFYEEYAGDGYYQGPELKIRADEGVYNIKVFSQDDEGKYVLVVGEKEEFPLGEMINTLFTLPGLKMKFFEKSLFAVFSGIVGLYLLIALVVVVGVIALLVWLMKRKLSKNRGIN